MGTDIYFGVVVSNAPKGILDSLYAADLMDQQGWDTGYTYDSEKRELVEEDTTYALNGIGRSGDGEELTAWAKEFTTQHPDTTVTISEEWNENEPGQEYNVYRKGELVREESKVNAMVPMDLAEMLAEARAALIAYTATGEGDRLAAPLEALVKGLT